MQLFKVTCIFSLILLISPSAYAYDWEKFDSDEHATVYVDKKTNQYDAKLKQARVWVRRVFVKIQQPSNQSSYDEIIAQTYFDCSKEKIADIQTKYNLNGKLVRVEGHSNYLQETTYIDPYTINWDLLDAVCGPPL